ncbi:general stress protein [Streptosporangium sp. NPDC000396]|uniref:general stress protein n=1 Tax=Streptosporangium sp. NPDC000396 TaxID=3366185 RepID=UPI003678C304
MTEMPNSLAEQVVVDRRVLVGYDNYLAAQRAVDMLSDAGFPVEHVAIVGSDLKLEETVTGRMTNGRAALAGAGNGVVFGAVVGMFLGLFTSTTMSFIVLVLWAALWGAVMGAAFGFINHFFTGGKRDFASRSAIVAGRYDVLVAASHLEHARAVIDGVRGPANTVVVEAPPSAGPYDPATAQPAAPNPTANHPTPASGRPAPASGRPAPASGRPAPAANHPASEPGHPFSEPKQPGAGLPSVPAQPTAPDHAAAPGRPRR